MPESNKTLSYAQTAAIWGAYINGLIMGSGAKIVDDDGIQVALVLEADDVDYMTNLPDLYPDGLSGGDNDAS